MNLTSIRHLVLLFLAVLSLNQGATADTIVFDLKGQGGIFDGNPTADFTVSGLTGTFTATGGTLNSNSGQFGIDGPADLDADAIEGSEVLTITFPVDVTFVELDLQDFGVDDLMRLTLGTNFPLTQGDNGTLDIFTYNSNNVVLAGDAIVFEAISGDFGISTFTVEAAAVPEPNTLAALGLAVPAIVARRRRR